MRVRLGILGPFLLQLGIIFLYSSIRYQEIQIALVTLLFIFIFPVLIAYVLAPHAIVFFVQLQKTIANRISDELEGLTISNSYEVEESRTQMKFSKLPRASDMQSISDSIKDRLIPLLTDRAVNHYKDTFYSREDEIKQERSLMYFEALVLFAGLTAIFFVIDVIVIWIISFRSLSFYFLELDKIESLSISVTLTIIFILGILFSLWLLRYSKPRFNVYLPYTVPILFNEPHDEVYLRRETIRSIVGYNYDNLLDRRDFKRISRHADAVLEKHLQPLLRDEVIITARKEFAHKLAWREYSKIIQSSLLSKDKEEKSLLELLCIGEKIGQVQIEEQNLLGLNSDIQYINQSIGGWQELSEETRLFIYFQLYRVVEFLMKEISASMRMMEDDEEFNLYSAINQLTEMKYLSQDSRTILHNLRYRRNKLMHEPGVGLDVSQDEIQKIVSTLENLLSNIHSDTNFE